MSFSKASQKHSPDQYGAVLIERENKKTPKTKQYYNILKREKNSATKIVAIACEWNISCGTFYIWPEANQLNTFNKWLMMSKYNEYVFFFSTKWKNKCGHKT